MTPQAELEQGVLDLIDAFSDAHTVEGAAVVCYVGRERIDTDPVTILDRTARTLAARTTQVATPLPDGELQVNGTHYTVGAVQAYSSCFISTLHRLR